MRSLSLVYVVGLFCAFGSWSVATPEDWSTLYGAARQEARQVSSGSLAVPLTAREWEATVGRRREMWREMLGLSPLPPRTPLAATVTGVLDRGDYVVEKVHFQSLPGAYVIGNLYRPAKPVGKLPAVLYLCGHSKGKVNAPYQANPRWFGQHGYVALVLDPIQLGESQGFHHGTSRENRWDWPSRGYTPAGTEVWNAMRALDYLETRADVDSTRMGVTGLSGGGVISWCLGAADERVKVTVPVCQSGSIEHVVFDRATDGHCDCAFWINYYRWCWPDIGALIAWRAHQQAALKRQGELTFRYTLPARAPRQRDFRADGSDGNGSFGTYVFDSFDGMTLGIKTKRPKDGPRPVPTLIFAIQPEARSTFAGGGPSRPAIPSEFATAAVEVRNTGATSVGPGYLWTARRTYPLLGETLPERQVSDLLAAAALLREEPVTGSVAVYGQGSTAPLAVYAALLDPRISEIVLADCPTSHEDAQTPEFLGVLRIGDLPHNLALAYPRPLTFVGKMPPAFEWTRQVYKACGAAHQIREISSMRDWRPAPVP